MAFLLCAAWHARTHAQYSFDFFRVFFLLPFFTNMIFVFTCAFTFVQLVIMANDVRFNRGGTHGQGDIDTIQGWLGEMDEMEASFNREQL